MAEKDDKPPEQVQQQASASGGSVVAVHMPNEVELPGVCVVEAPFFVSRVHVKPGDTVQPDAPLIAVNFFLEHVSVPSPVAGVIEAIHVAEGDEVSPGYLIATVRVWKSK
jgi:pyruvate dehydrogenase E2 component (dihydrolipoamide acetyltransferase)